MTIHETQKHNSREEGAAPKHAGLEHAAGRAQEEFHVVALHKVSQLG